MTSDDFTSFIENIARIAALKHLSDEQLDDIFERIRQRHRALIIHAGSAPVGQDVVPIYKEVLRFAVPNTRFIESFQVNQERDTNHAGHIDFDPFRRLCNTKLGLSLSNINRGQYGTAYFIFEKLPNDLAKLTSYGQTHMDFTETRENMHCFEIISSYQSLRAAVNTLLANLKNISAFLAVVFNWDGIPERPTRGTVNTHHPNIFIDMKEAVFWIEGKVEVRKV